VYGEERVGVYAPQRVFRDDDVMGCLRRGSERSGLPVSLPVGELLEDALDRVERVVLGDVGHRQRSRALEGEELILVERDLGREPVPVDDDGGIVWGRVWPRLGRGGADTRGRGCKEGDEADHRLVSATTRRYS
jgi:hypothetical protein